MFLLVLFLICVFITIGIGVLAGISDFRTMTIPNMYSVAVIATFIVAYVALLIGGKSEIVFGPLSSHLIAAGLAFAITFILFSLRMIGAGDSKFATAVALWFSLGSLPAYFFYMTLAGASLGIAALIIQRKKPFKAPLPGSWIAQVQEGASKVPYGAAIAFGMVIAFLLAGYMSPDVMSSLLPAEISPAEADGSLS